MGKDRNKVAADKRKSPEKIDFRFELFWLCMWLPFLFESLLFVSELCFGRNKSLCPYYLVDYCPHELFTNTKSDIGPCTREHDEKAKVSESLRFCFDFDASKAAWDALSP